MLLLKHQIFAIIIFLIKKSKPDECWSFFPSDEFILSDKSAELDKYKFEEYKYLKDIVTRNICLETYSDGFATLYDCNKYIEQPANPTSCDLIGSISGAEHFRNTNLYIRFSEVLIFLAFEGCCRVDKFRRSTSGTIIMNNDFITIDYRTLRPDYEWIKISFVNMPDCSSLCSNIRLDRITIELKEGEFPKRELFRQVEEDRLIKSQIDFFVKYSSVILTAILFALIVVKIVLNNQTIT